MAQLFPRSFNVLAQIGVVILIISPLGLMMTGSAISRSPFNTKVGVPLEQPVPFSHAHHVTELGIDCRYCHTGVEKSAHAGVPPTQTCMSCHSQIWTNSPYLQPVRDSYKTDKALVWAQVNKVPEFVYFNHSIHINRGLSCNNCHGAVGKMMLTYKAETLHMKWCLDCHRQPEKFLFTSTNGKKKGLTPREQVFDLYLQYQGDKHKLSTREKTLLDGKVDQYVPYASELEDGKKLAEQAGVKRKQLEDCSVCHR